MFESDERDHNKTAEKFSKTLPMQLFKSTKEKIIVNIETELQIDVEILEMKVLVGDVRTNLNSYKFISGNLLTWIFIRLIAL